MAKVYFVDDRIDEIIQQWQFSGCAKDHQLLPLEPFDSIEKTYLTINTFKPDVILVGYGLGETNLTGTDVIIFLRQKGYNGFIFANSGGSLAQFTRAGVIVADNAQRNPDKLGHILKNLNNERG